MIVKETSTVDKIRKNENVFWGVWNGPVMVGAAGYFEAGGS
jgi:hypothetical protein